MGSNQIYVIKVINKHLGVTRVLATSKEFAYSRNETAVSLSSLQHGITHWSEQQMQSSCSVAVLKEKQRETSWFRQHTFPVSCKALGQRTPEPETAPRPP